MPQAVIGSLARERNFKLVALPFTSVYPPLSALENVGINSTKTHKFFQVILI